MENVIQSMKCSSNIPKVTNMVCMIDRLFLSVHCHLYHTQDLEQTRFGKHWTLDCNIADL